MGRFSFSKPNLKISSAVRMRALAAACPERILMSRELSAHHRSGVHLIDEVRVVIAPQLCCPGGRNDVKAPLVTGGYVAILALLYAALSLQVVRLRRKNRVGFGDGGNDTLRCAIRAHAHFAEYVPITALMAAMLEMSGLV